MKTNRLLTWILILLIVLTIMYKYNIFDILFFQAGSHISLKGLSCNADYTICTSQASYGLTYKHFIDSNFTFKQSPTISKGPLSDLMIKDYKLNEIGTVYKESAFLDVRYVSACKPTEFSSVGIREFPICSSSVSRMEYIPAWVNPSLIKEYNDTDGCPHKVYKFTNLCTTTPVYKNVFGFGYVYICSCGTGVSQQIDVGGKSENKPLFTVVLNETDAFKKYGLNYTLRWEQFPELWYHRLYIKASENLGYYEDRLKLNQTRCIYNSSSTIYYEGKYYSLNITASGKISIYSDGTYAYLKCVLDPNTFEPDLNTIKSIIVRQVTFFNIPFYQAYLTIKASDITFYWDFRPDTDEDGIIDDEDLCPNEKGMKILDGCPPNDFDKDGIPDMVEIENGLNPKLNDSYLDLDNDGLSNLEEYNLGTNISNSDTDNDTVIDSIDKCPLEFGSVEFGGCKPPVCGDGICELDKGEDYKNCPQDCPVPPATWAIIIGIIVVISIIGIAIWRSRK